MKQQTANGASGTLMGVLKAIEENFDSADVISHIMGDLKYNCRNPKLVSLMRRRAEAVLNLRPMMKELNAELEKFLKDNPAPRNIN